MNLERFSSELKSVYEMCEPRISDRKISMDSLQNILHGFCKEPQDQYRKRQQQEYPIKSQPTACDKKTNFCDTRWLSYDEFCVRIEQLAEEMVSNKEHEDQNDLRNVNNSKLVDDDTLECDLSQSSSSSSYSEEDKTSSSGSNSIGEPNISHTKDRKPKRIRHGHSQSYVYSKPKSYSERGEGKTRGNIGGKNGSSPENNTGAITSTCSFGNDLKDLNQKIERLSCRIDFLNMGKGTLDDIHSQVKRENVSLFSRINDLEEELDSLQTTSLAQAQLRQNNGVANLMAKWQNQWKIEEERIIQRLLELESHNASLKQEVNQLGQEIDKINVDKNKTEDSILEAQSTLNCVAMENERLMSNKDKSSVLMNMERLSRNQKIEDLSVQMFSMADRKEQCWQLADLEREVKTAKDQVLILSAKSEDLESQLMGGLLNGGQGQFANEGHEAGQSAFGSIQQELEQLSSQELRKTLQNQREISVHLRQYIDSILIKIMERHPDLLEIGVKKNRKQD